jgi:hypothetical protein
MITALLVSCMSVAAQPVFVGGAGGSTGQGYMVTSGSTCYLLLPAHVTGGFPLVDVLTEAPVLVGQAQVQTPFWPRGPAAGIGEETEYPWLDLAVGVVRGAASERCETPLARFTPPRSLAGRTAELLTVERGGRLDRVSMAITQTRYLELEAEVRSPGKEMYPGRSGSFLFVDGRPVGMVVRAPRPDRAVFVRMEEIALNVGRWIQDQGAGFATGPGVEDSSVLSEGIAVRLVDWSAPPLSPEYPPQALLRAEGDFVTAPTEPLRLVFEVADGAVVGFSRVVVLADPRADYALPKDILIEVDSTPDRSRPRFFWAGDMAMDGRADTGPRLEVSARWFIITVSSAWAEGPIAIRQITFE